MAMSMVSTMPLVKVRNMPARSMSGMVKAPLRNTMALGGVLTGSMKAQLGKVKRRSGRRVDNVL